VSGSDPTPMRVHPEPRRLRDGDAVRFTVRLEGIEREAFAVRWRGALSAWLNACRHQHRPLDFGDGHFFDEEMDALVCCHHGARYRPDTGECVAGPCTGSRLTRLELEERADGLWCVGRVTWPSDGGHGAR